MNLVVSQRAAAASPTAGGPATPQAVLGVTHLTTWISRNGGGLTYSMQGLLKRLHERGRVRVSAIGVDDAATSQDLALWNPVPVQVVPGHGPRNLSYCPRMSALIPGTRPDLLHLHGVWSWPVAVCGRWHRDTAKPYLVTPHGMLDPWILGRGRWKKAMANLLYQRRVLREAGCIHALCEAERAAIRALGLRNPICVVPNGVDMPDESAPPGPPPWDREGRDARRTLLFLGRLHPKKGLAPLLHAWASRMRDDRHLRSQWRLIVAGFGERAYELELHRLIAQLGLADCATLVGPLHGADKAAALAGADAFVLPSFSEGLPMSVLEAWSHGLPVLMTSQCNLPLGFATDSALRIDSDAVALAGQLGDFMRGPDSDREAMGARGRALARDRFSWTRVASDLEEVYRWLLAGGAAPACMGAEAARSG